MTSRIAIPLPETWIQMRPSVERDGADVVHALVEDRHVAGRLQNLRALVVFLGDAWHRPRQASVVERNVFPGIHQLILADTFRRSASLVFHADFLSLLGKRRQASVLGINNDR